MEVMRLLIVALFGASVGSFTNVVVRRLHWQGSVVHPGSHCPRCGHAIRSRDNLPMLGWLLLGVNVVTAVPASAGATRLWSWQVPCSG